MAHPYGWWPRCSFESYNELLWLWLVDLAELSTVIADLRSEGSDSAEVEVKRASVGFPQSVLPTLSAFSNTPGGGILIFGLDESDGFKPVGVYDASECKAALASTARNGLEPPVTPRSQTFVVEGKKIIVARIDELSGSMKPCKVKSTGKSYLRSYDGDYELSQLEEQAFLANRETPRFDQRTVEGATLGDLDQELVGSYIDTCRSSVPLSRLEDMEILFRTGVVAGPDRVPTVAGLLALGIYPQQFFPNLVIQASVSPGPNDPAGTRAVDSRKFDGPVPIMLDEALKWVQRNTRTRVIFGDDGHGRDESEYPAEAVRELLSNALVHRDLGPHALGEAITLRIDARQLILSNPGGLWGLTVDRLGQTGVTSARNGYLVRICQNVRFARGNRVVEALASGIPTVLRSLREAGMVPPRWHDQGIRFTVRVPNHTLLSSVDLEWLAQLSPTTPLNDIQRHALVAMRHGVSWTNKTLRDTFPMDSLEARNILAGLVDAGVAEAVGERGGRIYRLASHLQTVSGRVQIRLPVFESGGSGLPSSQDGDAKTTPRVRGARRTNAERIAHMLADGPASSLQIQKTLGLSERQVGYAVSLLKEEGRVILRGGQGIRNSKWHLVEPGDG